MSTEPSESKPGSRTRPEYFFFQLCRPGSHTHTTSFEIQFNAKTNLIQAQGRNPLISELSVLHIKTAVLKRTPTFITAVRSISPRISQKQLQKIRFCTVTIHIVRTQHVHSFSSSARFSERRQLFSGDLGWDPLRPMKSLSQG